MRKYIYIILSLVTVSLIAYTGYYTYSKRTPPPPATVATSTEVVATTTDETPPALENKKVFTTKTGRLVTILETNPTSQSLSTITITTEGFATNTPLVLEKNKLTNSFFADINKDTYEELIMITTTQDSGKYSEATIYTTTHNLALIPVASPGITEADTKKGKLFEGYAGHDDFKIIDGVLVREFSPAVSTSTASTQNKPMKSIAYTLVEKNGLYSISFSKYVPTPTSTPQVASTTFNPATLPGTSWVWLTATASGTPFNAPQGDAFVITFDKGTTVHSTTDCNGLNGTYITSNDTLRFSDFASTLMACEGSQESLYSSLLSKVRFYKIDGGTLTFVLQDKEMMTFKLKK